MILGWKNILNNVRSKNNMHKSVIKLQCNQIIVQKSIKAQHKYVEQLDNQISKKLKIENLQIMKNQKNCYCRRSI